MGAFGFSSFDNNEIARDGKELSAALADFRLARRQAALNAVLGRLHGTSLELLSYEDVSRKLRVTGQMERGVREIPLDKIVGSVGRYDEFDRSFLPLKDHDAQRWAGLRTAAPDPGDLPAIDVYQIDDAYFVIDGNHRVSIARRSGMDYLEANVIEIQTRVPLPPGLGHRELIVASEYAAFLEHTRLDRLRPDADLEASLPGQYDKLENHIEVHRFFLELDGDRELSDEEAVVSWYDDAYLPVVEAIREQALLREFVGRTETDLYLWIAENQAALRNELGWTIRPQAAVENLPPHLAETRRGAAGRLYHRVRRAVIPRQRPPVETWSDQKLLDRYSDRLFSAVLAIIGPGREEAALAQAALLAQLDQAHLFALQITDSALSEAQRAPAREWFARSLRDARLQGQIGFEQGDLQADFADVIARRANLADLLVLDSALLTAGAAFVDNCPRPLLLVPGAARPIRRILLLYDGRPQAHEALFVAAYMAEIWGCSIVVLADPAAAPRALEEAAPYLEMHESPPESIIAAPLQPDVVFRIAAENECDLIIVGGYKKRPLTKSEVAAWLLDAARESAWPLLICP